MSDFKSLLAKRSSEVEKPKPLPAGTFFWLIKGHSFGESAQKKTPYARFTLQVLGPDEDVDAGQLEAFGGMQKLAQKTMNIDFYLTDDALWRLETFLTDHCKIEAGDRSIGERLPETTNVQIKGIVSHRPSQDGQDLYAEIKQTAPV